MVTLTTSDAVCLRVTMSITLWWCGREIDYAKCLCWFQMVGALADADDLSMSGIVYFLWVFSRNWHMSLSLWHVCVLFSSHCCLFWFLFGNLCIFTGFSHLLRFSFSLLGLWIFLLFSLWCASCFTLLSRVYGLCLRGFWILFYPLLIYVLCQLRVILYCWASYSPWMSSADLVLWSWISLILCSPFTSILYVLLILRMYYNLEYQWFCVLYLPQFRGFLLPSCRSSFWMNRWVMKSRLRIKFFCRLGGPPPRVNQLLTSPVHCKSNFWV
jgi:hypothetical protein